MILKLKELKRFADKSAHIKPNGILPVLNHIRLQDGVITRSDNHQYVSMKADFEGEALIDSATLFAYIGKAKGDITVTAKGTSMVLTDGVTTLKTPTDSIADYPAPQPPDGIAVTLSKDVCKAIGACSASVVPDEIQGQQIRHVFVGKNMVIGTGRFWGISFKIEDALPNLSLLKHEAEIIGSLPGCVLQENSNWHFISASDLTYGTVKSEAKWYDLTPYFAAGAPAFTLPREPVLEFCETVIAVCPGKDLLASLEAHGEVIAFAAKDKAYDVDVTREVACNGPAPLFGFDPRVLQRLLKVMPGTEYTFSPAKNMYHITSGQVTGLIMELILKQENQ